MTLRDHWYKTPLRQHVGFSYWRLVNGPFQLRAIEIKGKKHLISGQLKNVSVKPLLVSCIGRL